MTSHNPPPDKFFVNAALAEKIYSANVVLLQTAENGAKAICRQKFQPVATAAIRFGTLQEPAWY